VVSVLVGLKVVELQRIPYHRGIASTVPAMHRIFPLW
jgi:hypothetical protein